MKDVTLPIECMTCGHCKKTIEESVNRTEGVSFTKVDLQSKIVAVDHEENVTVSELKEVIEDQGYDVV